ncbi:MAG: TolC family protein [Bacteroidetes bacterium]|nr:TolC family protein [Bacteroidota bacterium]
MRKILIISIFFYFSFETYSQEKIETLNEMLSKIQTDFPSLKQIQFNIDAIKAKSQGAKTWMNPVFSLGFTRVPYDYSILSNKKSQMNQAGVTIGIEQMIPDLKKQTANEKYLLSLSEIEKCNLEKQKNELRLAVKQMYYNRLIAEKKLNILKKSEEILSFLIKTETEKLEFNKADLLSIYKAKARLAEIGNMKIMLEGMINESNAGLNILMQRDVNTKFEIDTSVAVFKYLKIAGFASEMTHRSEFAAMDNMIKSMKLEQKAMKMKLRPEFGVKAEHMDMVAMPSQWAIMGMFTLPVKSLSDRMIKSELKSMQYRINAMEEEKSAMKIMIDKMVAEKLEILKTKYKLYQNFEREILPMYEKNFDVNIYSYSRNNTNLASVLDAAEMLNMKKIELIDIFSEILKTEAEYEYEKEIK